MASPARAAKSLTLEEFLRMPEIDVEIPVEELYAGLNYSAPADAEPAA